MTVLAAIDVVELHSASGVRLAAESLRIDTATLWSSVSVQVQTRTKP